MTWAEVRYISDSHMRYCGAIMNRRTMKSGYPDITYCWGPFINPPNMHWNMCERHRPQVPRAM